MARPQARPQGNFLQIALITILLMISYQMLCVSNKPNDPRTRMQVQAELEQQNMNLLDLKIVETERLLIAKIDEELKAGKLTKQEADEARLASVLTVAATQFQTGVAWNHYAKIDRSYTTLAAQYESYRRTPLWKNVDVTVRGRDGAPVAVTAESLYNEITTELSARNKKEIVWGVLPGWQLIDVLVKATGSIPSFSYAFAAFLLALVVRGIIWPLAHKQYQWGRQMAQLSPRIKEIQDKYKDKKTGQVKDPQAFQMETMAIYKQYGINPMAGCWPALIQMPLFLAVYQGGGQVPRHSDGCQPRRTRLYLDLPLRRLHGRHYATPAGDGQWPNAAHPDCRQGNPAAALHWSAHRGGLLRHDVLLAGSPVGVRLVLDLHEHPLDRTEPHRIPLAAGRIGAGAVGQGWRPSRRVPNRGYRFQAK